MADIAKRGRDKVCPDFSVDPHVSVDKCYFDSDSHKYSETLGENVTQLNGTVTFLFHQTMKAAVQFDSDKKTVQVFMNDLTKEPDFRSILIYCIHWTSRCSGQLVWLCESSSCRF